MMTKALLFMLLAFCYNTNFLNGSEAEVDCFDTIHIRKIKEKEIHIHVPEKYTDHFPSEPTEVPVKRIHSRHRRFVAPGALWQNRVGFMMNWPNSADIAYNININYNLDYLFGGTIALASRLAANTAAKNASVVVFDTTRTKLNILSALTPAQIQALKDAQLAAAVAAAIAAGKRKKRAAAGNPLLQAIARRKRSAGGDDDVVVDNEEEVNNILTRTVADDQLAILKNIEDSLDRGGLSGRQCVLRAICELKETPIHEWSLIGEMIANFMLPKKDNLTALDEYRKAETIGEEHGDCWSFYSACPFSIFNIIPDIYTKDDQIKVTFDDFSAGSGTTKEGPDSEFANDDNGHPDGNAEDDIFEDNADDSLKILLKQFGGTVDDVKEVKIDLDLAKP